MAKTNRYKKLFSNTMILGIGTFISKVLTVLLMPLYTSYLTQGEYGSVDLVVQAANLLIPVASLGINNAILRFGMDGKTNHREMLSTAFTVDLVGFGVFLLFYPLVAMIPKVGDYAFWVYLFVFCSVFHYLIEYFVKSLQKVRFFAVCRVIGTAMTLLLDILLLVVLRMGVVGYMLAILISDSFCALLLVAGGRLYRYIHPRYIRKSVMRRMLRYSIPLIPTTALWWVTDVSDRYMVAAMISEAANGLYAAAYKVPNLLILICGIFIDAWQISILSEKSRLEQQKFFSRIFSMYQSIIFVCSSGLVMCAKLITRILVANTFYESWQYMPTLVIATALSCFVTFLGTIYIVEKRSKDTLWTTAVGTVFNVIGNFVLIKAMGVHGAALSTALSYLLVFLLRSIHSRKYVKMRWDKPRVLSGALLLTAQCIIMICEVRFWIVYEILLFTAMLLIQFRPLILGIRQFIRQKRGH